MPTTYAKVIRQLIWRDTTKIFVLVMYPTGTHEWLPVDKKEYLHQLRQITDPDAEYPCRVELEPAGEVYINPCQPSAMIYHTATWPTEA